MSYLYKNIRVFSLLVVWLGLILPLTSNAQSLENLFEPVVNISISPESPGKNTEAVATVNTNTFNINTAFIAWALNGNVLDQGTGNATFRFNTGDSFETISLEVIIQPAGDNTGIIRKTLTITPAEVDIIWEANGYTPPFYKGKSHVTFQSQIIFTAIPHIIANGERVSTKDLVYTWSKDDRVQPGQSGFGRDAMIHTLDFLSRPFTISVTAQTLDGDVVAQNSIAINPRAPQFVFYEEDPLLGVKLEKGFLGKQIPMSQQELWLKAVPYFIDTTDFKSGVQNLVWEMNGAPILDNAFQDKIILRRPQGVDNGRVNIIATAENKNKPLQSLEESFSILIQPLISPTSQF